MPGQPLTPTLPPNVDGDTGWQINTTLAPFGPRQVIDHVPSGYAWLIQAVCLQFTTDATAGNRVIELSAEIAQDGSPLSSVDQYWFAATGAIGPSESGRVTFGLGLTDLTVPGLGAFGQSEWNAALPYTALLPGTLIRLGFEGTGGPADTFTNTPQWTVTQWEFGGGGGGGAEPIGPFMFVPGPTEGVAA